MNESIQQGGVRCSETRKAAACRAFWSDAPLNVRYREVVGDRPFSLKEFVAFVMDMPAEQFSAH
ncbi:hypothetical protein [Tardiphaga sp.]|uniref:hypothetical protein n=1 Tax=Tardiphaga sp. TaxID=1926292 RepID=UPI002610C7A9|nr:hypothetical protein [Tardiphaga sp.]MDB5621067.1 hypothetical protein [Tardiphaga sp.]